MVAAMRSISCVTALLSLPGSLAFAQDAGEKPAAPPQPPPPADEIKRVMDYYYYGKDRGPALVELKACLKVDTAGVQKLECIEPVNGAVKKDTVVHWWTSWYLPEGANYDNVVMQFVFGNDARSTIDLK